MSISRLIRPRRLVKIAVTSAAALLILTSGPRSVLGRDSDPVVPMSGESTTPSIIAAQEKPPEVPWQVLAGLDYTTGEMSKELQPLLGKEVKIPGFMVPLEDFAETASEFLLVPYQGACVHVPPPPPNQLVYVVMNGNEKVPVYFWDPVWLYGTLEVEETENIYTTVSFKLDGIKVEKYVW